MEAGLAEFGARVRFRHPLVRSAAYRSASVQDRQELHARAGRGHRPGGRSRSAGLAPGPGRAGPDEEVAAELERSAGRAQARGGLAAAAAFLERSALLTADPARRARAGAGRGAGQACRPAPSTRRSDLLAMARGRAAGRAAARPRRPAARADRVRLEPRQRRAPAAAEGGQAARAARRRAGPRDLPGGVHGRAVRRPPGQSGGARDVARAARAAPAAAGTRRAPPDLLLDGLALLVTDGLRGRAPAAEAGAARLPRPGHPGGGGAELAVARRTGGHGGVGRRDLAHPGQPSRQARA